VNSASEKGYVNISGNVHFFFKQPKDNSQTSLVDMQRLFGYKVIGMSQDKEAALLEPSFENVFYSPTGEIAQGESPKLFYGMEGGNVKISHATFYLKSSIVHMVYSFCNGLLKQEHLKCSYSPLDRRAILLELITCDKPPYSIFDPSRKNLSTKFVASPFSSLMQSWGQLIDGTGVLLNSPVSCSITKHVSASWELGPNAENVGGVDFSRKYSKHPLYAIAIQRHRNVVVMKFLMPYFLGGVVGLFSLGSFGHKPNGNNLILAITAMISMLIVRSYHFTLYEDSSLLDLYFVIGQMFNILLLVFTVLEISEDTRSILVWVMSSTWVLFHLLIFWYSKGDTIRGTWDNAVTDAKLSASVKADNVPEVFTNLFGNSHKSVSNKYKIKSNQVQPEYSSGEDATKLMKAVMN